MKLSIAFMSVAVLVLAGCGRQPVVKETVIERPVVKETTVVQPAPAAGATVPSCTYASQSYSHGAISCQDRTQYRCDNGVWNRTLNPC